MITPVVVGFCTSDHRLEDAPETVPPVSAQLDPVTVTATSIAHDAMRLIDPFDILFRVLPFAYLKVIGKDRLIGISCAARARRRPAAASNSSRLQPASAERC